MAELMEYLTRAARDGASDIFMVPGAPVSFKREGLLQPMEQERLMPDIQGGQVPAFEIMHMNSAIRSMIRDSKNHQIAAQIAAGGPEGMMTMDQSILSLYRAGRITRQTALDHADNPEQMQRLLNG